LKVSQHFIIALMHYMSKSKLFKP